MALPMVPIYTQTVGAGGASAITFNNIPQSFTDLKIVCSVRSTQTFVIDNMGLHFNNDYGTNYSLTRLYGSGSSVTSDRYSNASSPPNDAIAGANATANTFGNSEYYIPNYTSSNFKQYINDGVAETNGTQTYMVLNAGLWRSTSAITSIKLDAQPFVQYSTFSLYGILRAGA